MIDEGGPGGQAEGGERGQYKRADGGGGGQRGAVVAAGDQGDGNQNADMRLVAERAEECAGEDWPHVQK